MSGGCATKVKWVGPDILAPAKHGLWGSVSSRDPLDTLYAEAIRAEAEGLEQCVDLFYHVAVATCHHDGPKCSCCRLRRMHKSA